MAGNRGETGRLPRGNKGGNNAAYRVVRFVVATWQSNRAKLG